MDMHFPTDLLVYVGSSKDYLFNTNTIWPWDNIPVVVAMSIADPTFKWTLAAVEWNERFADVDISDDGEKAVVAGTEVDSKIQVIIWVLDTTNGSIISQKVVKVLGSGSTPQSLTSRRYKQALIRTSEPVIYLLLRTNTPNTSIYMAKFDYLTTSVSP
jgi:hypothetical protein